MNEKFSEKKQLEQPFDCLLEICPVVEIILADNKAEGFEYNQHDEMPLFEKLKVKTYIQKIDPEEKYDVSEKSEIGGGCMATVFKVTRKGDKKEFAMKVI
jgi:hypothetical protein